MIDELNEYIKLTCGRCDDGKEILTDCLPQNEIISFAEVVHDNQMVPSLFSK